jgi:FMN phosphatase YigB (HAD superfamily)
MTPPKISAHQIILFDVDKTLHNNDEFRRLYKAKAFQYLSIDEKTWDEARKSYDATLPERRFSHAGKMLKHISSYLKIDPAGLRKAHYATENYEKALFGEVKTVLQKLQKTHTLGLFTEGYKSHQFRKIKKGGLLEYFHPDYHYILFNKRTPKVLEGLPKNAVVIDDNPEVIEVLLKRLDLTVIWLNRINQDKHPKAYTIHSLTELLELV